MAEFLLKNSLLNFDKFTKTSVIPKLSPETDMFYISDYTSKMLKEIAKLPAIVDGTHTQIYNLMDEEMIESVSFNLYNDEKYWDLLLIINNRDPLFGMAYSFDNIRQASIDKVQKYVDNTLRHGLSTERFNALTEEVFVEKYVENELNRTLIVIRPEMMQDFIRILRVNNITVS